jgi:hypothetical protein
MNWKRFLLIALVAGGFAFVSTPRCNAGVRVGIGIGLPLAYPYPYPYYGYGYYRPYYYGPYYAAGPRFYWYRGHRVYYSHRHYRHYRHWR